MVVDRTVRDARHQSRILGSDARRAARAGGTCAHRPGPSGTRWPRAANAAGLAQVSRGRVHRNRLVRSGGIGRGNPDPPRRPDPGRTESTARFIQRDRWRQRARRCGGADRQPLAGPPGWDRDHRGRGPHVARVDADRDRGSAALRRGDRKSTRLNSSHVAISYAVFCLKKKKKKEEIIYIVKKKKKKT